MKKYFLFLLLSLVYASGFSMQQTAIDSLENTLANAKGLERSKILMELSAKYQSISLQKSLDYDLENAKLQEELGSIKNLSGTLNNIGVSYYMLGDYGKSLDYFDQSLALREKLNDTVNIVKTLNNLGVISQISGDFNKALEYLERSLIFKLDLNDTLSTAKTLNNIGVIYKDVGNFADAQKFLMHALDFYLAVDNQSGIAASYNNLGQIFEARKNPDSALIYYQKSLSIKRIIDDQKGIGNTLNNLGLIYLAKDDLQQAEHYYREAIEIRKKIDDKYGLASSLNNMGNLYLREKKYTLAEEKFRESKTIAENENLMGIMQRNYASLSLLYEETGNIKKALDYHRRYAAARDSIFNQDLNKQIADLKIKYESEKSKRELEILRKENQIQELKISNSQKERVQLIAIILTLFFAFILIVLYMQYRSNKKLNEQLQQSNRELETKVKERTRELEEANASKDRFFSIIAHDLKSPFNGLLGFTEILTDDFDELSEHQKKEYAGYIKDSGTTIYKLLENLLEWSASQTGRLAIDKAPLELKALVEDVIAANSSTLRKKRIDTQVHLHTNSLAFADENMLRTVLRNLLSNAIKFTPSGGNIDVYMENFSQDQDPPMIITRIKDSGVGIRKEDLDKLFDLYHNFRTQGTDKEPGTGLGLILCRDFIEKNNGNLMVESKPGQGSTFSFTLPLA